MSRVSDSPQQIRHPDGFAIQVKRSRRKTMALKVSQGEVTVHMPQRMPLDVAHQFVSEKTRWLRRQRARYAALPQRGFEVGEAQLFLGEWYPSVYGSDTARRTAVFFTDARFVLETRRGQPADSATFHEQLKSFYRQQARDYLVRRVHNLAGLSGLQPASVHVRYYKSRWGSCHANREIRLNWQLIQAPEKIIDYVILHELCHLRHMNHSPAFWSLVEAHCPDYRQHRHWLRDNGSLLQL